ncbi:MAG: PTS sugar transporter subunit IIB [Pseudomonadota bacterium]
MPIVLVRVDDRLIHGQVVEAWLPSTGAEELLVANDAVAEDPLQRMIVQSAAPGTVRITIDTVDRIAVMLQPETNGGTRRMVLVNNPRDALRLKLAGVPFDSLNLGNLTTDGHCVCVSRSVYLGEDSIRVLCRIVEAGVRVSIQGVPFEKPIEMTEYFGNV